MTGSGSKLQCTTHVRAPTDNEALLLLFIVASAPAMLVTMWSTGSQLLADTMLHEVAAWRMELLSASGLPASPTNWLACTILGLTYAAPLLLTVGCASLMWAHVFATKRKRAIDTSWILLAWLYVLLIPTDMSLLLALVGISFAAVMGLHIFGGAGRYIVSPALLGAIFVQVSYPDAGIASNANTWLAAVAANGNVSDVAAAREAIGSGVVWMAIACAIGVIVLVRTDVVSYRTVAAALAGIVAFGLLAGRLSDNPMAQLPVHWHLGLGYLPICIAFVLTDPTSGALTKMGEWCHGLLFALLVVLIRLADPTSPEGTLSALLLAVLFVPLIDNLVIRLSAYRHPGQLELRS